MAKLAKVTEVRGCTSISDILHQSGTDWDVEVLDANIDSSAGVVRHGDFRALVRPDTNTALAFVGQRYRANNHREQLCALERFITDGDIVPESVSMWDNGATLAFQFRCPGLDVTIRDQDVVSPLLTLAYAYGSQLADSAFFADFRWFCKNQLGQVAKLNTNGRVMHRGDIKGNYADMIGRRLQQLSSELGDRYKAMRAMTQAPLLPGRALCEYFGEAIGASKEDIDQAWVKEPKDLRGTAAKIPEILECYSADDAGAPSTVWQAYNAVTRYETHRDGRSAETRHRRMLLGSGSDVANNAWAAAARMAA